MNNLKLTNYGKPTQGIRTEINGVELREVGDISLTCPVDGLPVLRVQQNIYPGLDVTINGLVAPELHLLDDTLELHVEHPTPTSTRYWATRREVVRS